MTTIAEAVAPLKQQAIDAAAVYAKFHVERLMVGLEAAGWDAQVYAPYPNARNFDKRGYTQARLKYEAVRSFSKQDPSVPPSYMMGAPEPRVRNEEGIAAFIEQSRAQAAAEFDGFVAKLEGKVGQYDSARLDQQHGLWQYSIVVVTKGSTVERWKTQQILNVSVLGNVFNQWPTRKVK